MAKRKDRGTVKLQLVIKDIARREGRVEPRIIAKSIELSERYLKGDLQRTVLQLVKKCDLADSSPHLTAAKVLFKMGSYELASSLLDRMTLKNDLTMWEYIKGRICQEQNDDSGAYDHYVQCYLNDDSFLPVYDRLHALREDEEWDHRKRIAAFTSGNDEPCDGLTAGPIGDLVSYYAQWMNGNRSAIQSIKASQHYKDGNLDYLLASARMEELSGDHAAAASEYEKMSAPGYSVSLEMAESLMKAKRFPEAESVCRGLSLKNTGDRRLNELLMRLYVMTNDRTGLMSTVKKYLSYDYSDADAYTLACRCLMDMSMYADASILIDRMIDSGIPEAYRLSAENDYLLGRYSHALRSINRSLKIHPNDMEQLILKSKILLGLGKTAKALGNLEYILSTFGDVPEALSIKRDILADKGDLEGAYGLCERIRAVSGDSPELLGYMADLLKRMDRPDDAVRLYRDAVGIREDHNLFIQVVTSLIEDGKYEDAASMADEYDDTYGDIQATWILKGNAEYACGRYAEALDSYNRALEIDHSDPVLWHSKGMAAEAIKDYDAAEEAYDRAVILDLENPDYWISRSVVKEKLGDLTAAVDSLNHVISEYPENTYALIRKSHILSSMGRLRDALVFADLASKIVPDDYDILRIRKNLNERISDFRTAKEIAKRMAELRPDDTKAVLDYARMCISDRDYDEALSILAKGPRDDLDILRMRSNIQVITDDKDGILSTCARILELSPDDERALMLIADTYTALGNKEKASEIYERLNSLRPDDDEIRIKQDRLDSEIDKDTTLRTLKERIEDDPNDIGSILRMVDALVGMERYEEAESYSDMAIRSAPGDPRTYLRKAELKMDIGLYRDALDVLEEAKGNSIIQDARIWELAGDIHARLGETEQALLSYDSAMKMDDSLHGIHTKIGELHERNGSLSTAMENYQKAYEKDNRDTKAMYRMSRMLFQEGKAKTANRYVDEILNIDGMNGDALILKCKILADSGDTESIIRLIERAKDVGVDAACIDEMESILGDIDIRPVEEKDDEDIDALSMRLLRCAYDRGTSPDDPETIAEAGIDQSDIGRIMVFLSDIDRCREFTPAGEWFDRMELLSMRAISNSNIDMENERMMPLQTAMFAGEAESIREAKELVSYVYKVMTMDIEPYEFDQRIGEIRDRYSSEYRMPTVRDVVVENGIGLYSARTIVMLLKEADSSIVDHI